MSNIWQIYLSFIYQFDFDYDINPNVDGNKKYWQTMDMG